MDRFCFDAIVPEVTAPSPDLWVLFGVIGAVVAAAVVLIVVLVKRKKKNTR